MNAAQLLAWLICLALAFLAGVLGVFNVGKRIALERDVQTLSEKVGTLAAARGATGAAEREWLRRELGRMRAELRELAQTPPSEASDEVRQRLADLEEGMRVLEQRLQ